MANYVKATNFAVKDTLASGTPAKIVKGTEIDTELNAIAAAIASKPDAESPTLTGTPLAPTPSTATNNTQISTTAYVVNRIAQDIAGKANIASPTFTGIPAAPTATAGTNTTQLATTAFVKTAVDTAVGGVDSGVLTFSGGTTGLTPSTASAGAIVLAGTLGVANGGTGQTTYTNGQLLIGNSTGNTLSKATLTAGNGISITNGAGSITVAQSIIGPNVQVFTSNGTFTIPTGVTKLKVTVVGGGGAGGYGPFDGYSGFTRGAGGGGGGAAIKWLAVTGGTLAVTVGGSAQASSVASGTQSITTISATAGGSSSAGSQVPGSGGNGSNGDLNIEGSSGFFPSISGGQGGGTILAGTKIGPTTAITGFVGSLYGGGGTGSGGGVAATSSGAAGVVIFEW